MVWPQYLELSNFSGRRTEGGSICLRQLCGDGNTLRISFLLPRLPIAGGAHSASCPLGFLADLPHRVPLQLLLCWIQLVPPKA